MRNWRLAIAAAVIGAFAQLAGATSASAYPDVTCHITDPGKACEGEPLKLVATVDPDVQCSPIRITWNGMTRTGTGPELTATFPTKEGDADRSSLRTDQVSCTFTDAAGDSQTVSAQGTVEITECDDGDNDDSDGDSDDSDDDGNGLPNTGGERLLWLLIGLLLVAGGTAVIVTSRREDEAES